LAPRTPNSSRFLQDFLFAAIRVRKHLRGVRHTRCQQTWSNGQPMQRENRQRPSVFRGPPSFRHWVTKRTLRYLRVFHIDRSPRSPGPEGGKSSRTPGEYRSGGTGKAPPVCRLAHRPSERLSGLGNPAAYPFIVWASTTKPGSPSRRAIQTLAS